MAKSTKYNSFPEQMIARENALPSFAFALGASSLLAVCGGPLTLEAGGLLVRLTFVVVTYVGFLKLYCHIRDSARIRLAAVYVLGVALTVAATVIIVNAPEWFGPESVRGREYATIVGGYERVSLSDGSQMELNTASHVRVRYSSHRREVALQQGEARFSVVYDQNRPFVVRTDHIVANVVGTVFSVYLRDNGTVEVLVEKGRVEISRQNSARGTWAPFILVPGERALLEGGVLKRQEIGLKEVETHVSWTTGTLSFESEALGVVAREANRYSHNQVVIDSPQAAGILIGGRFHANDLEAFAMLIQVFGLRVTKTVDPDGRVVFHVTEP